MPRLLAFLAFLTAPVAAFHARAEEPKPNIPKPNILVILADDMGYADLGAHGCKNIPTPHIDSIAKAGVRCTSGYVSGPYCSPTRAGLLTGRYQQRFGHEFNPGMGPRAGEIGLPVSERTIADHLKQEGYVTGLVGKWHLGNAEQFHPNRRGFDEFFGFLGGAHPYFAGQGAPIYRNSEVVSEREYLTDAFGREAASFIERHKDRPFFLFLSFNAVHTPMHATDAGLQKFAHINDLRRRTYAAMLSSMDDAVGQTLDRLRAHRLEEKTLIFFFSDNGGPTMRGTSLNSSDNVPFRGSKRTTLEGGIRVPFFVQWKSKLPAGKVYHQPVIQLDIVPTSLAAAGVKAQASSVTDGVDLLPHLRGEMESPPHEALYWRLGQQMAIRRGDWKLVRYDTTADAGLVAAQQPAKKDRAPLLSSARLYNLAADSTEHVDLAALKPDLVKELQAAWDNWNEKNVPPRWGGGARGRKAAAKRAAKENG
ncbi:MAG: sulfatase-like hydrolase/transferase [Pirellulales bacterium]